MHTKVKRVLLLALVLVLLFGAAGWSSHACRPCVCAMT